MAALGRRAVRLVAPRPRVRAPLRLPAGRHQPLGPEPGLRQPLHRASAPARGRLPPQRGPGRPGRPHGPGPAAGRPGQALLPLLRPRRHACAAPRRPRVGRALPRGLRQGMGHLARGAVRPPGRHGSRSRGDRAHAAPGLGAGMEPAHGRRTPAAGPPTGGLRWLLDPHRRPDRPGAHLAREHGADGQHGRHGVLRQRRQRRGGQGRQRQRAPLQRAPPRVAGRQPRPLRRLGRVHHLQPLLVGLGLGGQHAAQALEALHLARRHPHAAHRPLGRPHRAPGRDAVPVRARPRPDAYDHGRRRAGGARRSGRRGPAGPRRRQHAGRARGPRRRRSSTTRSTSR